MFERRICPKHSVEIGFSELECIECHFDKLDFQQEELDELDEATRQAITDRPPFVTVEV